jgi:hypothetical protein
VVFSSHHFSFYFHGLLLRQLIKTHTLTSAPTPHCRCLMPVVISPTRLSRNSPLCGCELVTSLFVGMNLEVRSPTHRRVGCRWILTYVLWQCVYMHQHQRLEEFKRNWLSKVPLGHTLHSWAHPSYFWSLAPHYQNQTSTTAANSSSLVVFMVLNSHSLNLSQLKQVRDFPYEHVGRS